MAFDGICINNLVNDFSDMLLGGRIYKIAQPENDELLITVKTAENGNQRLLLSASASLPLAYITEENKKSPITAPNFCMLLRKHIQNGRITDITQPNFERAIDIGIDHLNEMGDMCHKHLIIELMGKHSNIIFTDNDNKIIDAIKHVPASVSSVREVLPGREYFLPQTSEKKNPLAETIDGFKATITSLSMPIYKAIYSSYTGLSPFMAQEICTRAHIDADESTQSLSDNADTLAQSFQSVMDTIKEKKFSPVIIYENNVPIEFASFEVSSYPKENQVSFDNISSLLSVYYAQKELTTRIRQRSVDLRKIVQTILERDVRKYELQLKQLKDTEKMDTYRVYGELLNTYGYGAALGDKSITVNNYYTNSELTIPLDPTLTPLQNAQKYFDKYNKLKRTAEALSTLMEEVHSEIEHLYSLQNSLDIARDEEDLKAIKEEMIVSGYIRRKSSEKKASIKSKPLHYVTEDGFHIYVGKNNLQNEDLTFNFANGGDWWFHAKKMPGSHVILKTEGREVSDSAFENAARLAAYYSKAKGDSRVEIDYVLRKEVKHPNGSKPGFVVYYTNYSMLIDPDISALTEVKDN